jgi:hypothetical protein
MSCGDAPTTAARSTVSTVSRTHPEQLRKASPIAHTVKRRSHERIAHHGPHDDYPASMMTHTLHLSTAATDTTGFCSIGSKGVCWVRAEQMSLCTSEFRKKLGCP